MKSRLKDNISLDSFFMYDFQYNIHDAILSSDLYKKIIAYPKKKWVSANSRRLEVIAFDIYKNTNRWIVLAIYNEITDPFVVPDKVYFIPKDDFDNMLN